MASVKPPNPPVKDEIKPAKMGVRPRPGTQQPKPKPMIITDFASI